MSETYIKMIALPFEVPCYVRLKFPSELRPQAHSESPLFRLESIGADLLSELCDDFRENVFKEAKKTDPRAMKCIPHPERESPQEDPVVAMRKFLKHWMDYTARAEADFASCNDDVQAGRNNGKSTAYEAAMKKLDELFGESDAKQ